MFDMHTLIVKFSQGWYYGVFYFRNIDYIVFLIDLGSPNEFQFNSIQRYIDASTNNDEVWIVSYVQEPCDSLKIAKNDPEIILERF